MRKTFLPALALLLVLTGCAQNYVIKMSDGTSVQSKTKPKLVNGFYHYTDASGQEGRPIYSGRIREIAPASMVTDETAGFKPVQSR